MAHRTCLYYVTCSCAVTMKITLIIQEAEVEQMYKLMYSLVVNVLQSNGIEISRESVQQGYFSCLRSTTEATYRTTITGSERVSAAECTDLIQQWVESGVTTRVQWYVINFDKKCPVPINSVNDKECGNVGRE